MERLTDTCWRNLDPWECCGQDKFCKRGCHDVGGCNNGCVVPKLYARLAAYEDTGLEPEEVAELTSPEVVEVARLFSELVNKGNAQRIVELAQADREGRCVVLPCKVGDKVYFALLGRIFEKPVFSIVSFANSKRIYCAGTSEYFRPEDVGKTVFLTREEAEQALEVMKDG